MLTLDKIFSRRGAQKKVAEFLLKNAVRVSAGGKLHVGELEIAHTAVAEVLDVDRRVIKATVDSILADPKLAKIYSKLDYALLLRDVAPELGFGAIEIIPTDAAEKGIIAGVTKVIVDSGISIRQIMSDDPMIPGAETTVITEKPLPRALIDKMLRIRGVKKVIVIS